MPIKFFIFLLIMIEPIYAGDQLVVVLGEEMNGTSGVLKRYEKRDGVYEKISSAQNVVVGRHGFGWAEGSTDLKMEGDGKSPAGIFPIVSIFGYDVHPIAQMPYDHADDKLICVDDVNDSRYNQLVRIEDVLPKSFEWMHREDGVYRFGAVIGYNMEGKSGRGSCIFFHLNHSDHRPTSGCTAMDEEGLNELLHWLDPAKHPRLLQIPKNECQRYEQEFAGIECE